MMMMNDSNNSNNNSNDDDTSTVVGNSNSNNINIDDNDNNSTASSSPLTPIINSDSAESIGSRVGRKFRLSLSLSSLDGGSNNDAPATNNNGTTTATTIDRGGGRGGSTTLSRDSNNNINIDETVKVSEISTIAELSSSSSSSGGGEYNNKDTNGITQKQTQSKDNQMNIRTKTSIATTITSTSTVTNNTISSNNININNTSIEIPKEKEKKKTYREISFDKVLSKPVVNLNELRKLCWNGIPDEHRPIAWKILLGYLPTNSSRRSAVLQRKRSEYKDAVSKHYSIDDNARSKHEQETLRQVLVDVPRTAPGIGLFSDPDVRLRLGRLLYTWAARHPASSYVQGINDLATPLIVVFVGSYFEGKNVLDDGNNCNSSRGGAAIVKGGKSEVGDEYRIAGGVLQDLTPEILDEVEADVYWCLTNLLSGIQDHYTSDQPGVQRMVMRLEELINRIDVDLALHLRETGVEFMQFSFRWMNCLLLREFKLDRISRLWDTYLSEEGGYDGVNALGLIGGSSSSRGSSRMLGGGGSMVGGTMGNSGKSSASGFETFHVYVCAAFLCKFSDKLRVLGFDELFGFMQNIPTSAWGDDEIEILLSQAFVLSTLFHGSDAHLTPVVPTIRK